MPVPVELFTYRLRVGVFVLRADAVVVVVGGDRFGGVAVAQVVECVAFPLVFLPAVVGEFDRGQPSGECGEGSAGVDLGQVVVVSDHPSPPKLTDWHHDAGPRAGGRGMLNVAKLAAGGEDYYLSSIARTVEDYLEGVQIGDVLIVRTEKMTRWKCAHRR